MNFYKRHIGDYIKATAHLSLLEHGVYTRLLDVYYTREAPIPDDQAARLIGAKSKEERSALKLVLEEFFVINDAKAWQQSRCDQEISIANEKADRNREVGKKGGRPKKLGSETEPTNNPDGYFPEPINNPIQTPDSRLQTPVTTIGEKRAVRAARASRRLPSDFDPEPYRAWTAEKHPTVDFDAQIAKLRDHQFKDSRTDWPATIRNWMRKAEEFSPSKLNGHGAMKAITPLDPWGNDKKTIAEMVSKGKTDHEIFEALDCMRSMQWIRERKVEISSEQH